jgi:hypothetical protein
MRLVTVGPAGTLQRLVNQREKRLNTAPLRRLVCQLPEC